MCALYWTDIFDVSAWGNFLVAWYIVGPHCLDHIDISSPGHHWTHIAAAILASAHDISCFVDNLILIRASISSTDHRKQPTHSLKSFEECKTPLASPPPQHLVNPSSPSPFCGWDMIREPALYGWWLNRPSWYNIYMTCTAAAPIIDLSQIGPAPLLPPFYIYPLCSHS